MIHSQGIPGRLLAVFLSLLLLAGLLPASPAFAEEQSIQAQLDEPEDGISTEHLTVANTTRMTGRFFLDSWGNVTSDTDVRSLIHDYNLVMWDRDNAMFDINPTVVSGVAGYQSANGDLTFILALYRALKYSAGSSPFSAHLNAKASNPVMISFVKSGSPPSVRSQTVFRPNAFIAYPVLPW